MTVTAVPQPDPTIQPAATALSVAQALRLIAAHIDGDTIMALSMSTRTGEEFAAALDVWRQIGDVERSDSIYQTSAVVRIGRLVTLTVTTSLSNLRTVTEETTTTTERAVWPDEDDS